MARGRDAHQARKQAVTALGRTLARRSKSRCELCDTTTSLAILEVDGSPGPVPDESWAVMVCDRCTEIVSGASVPSHALRFLETTAWSEVQPVQVLTLRLLYRLAKTESWAQDTLDMVPVSEDIHRLL